MTEEGHSGETVHNLSNFYQNRSTASTNAGISHRALDAEERADGAGTRNLGRFRATPNKLHCHSLTRLLQYFKFTFFYYECIVSKGIGQ